MTDELTEFISIAQECGATHYSPPPMRAVRGLSFTYEQLSAYVERIIAKTPEVVKEMHDIIERESEVKQQLLAAQAVIAELVACKALKERIDEYIPDDDFRSFEMDAAQDLREEYHRREPLAWAAAKEAQA